MLHVNYNNLTKVMRTGGGERANGDREKELTANTDKKIRKETVVMESE